MLYVIVTDKQKTVEYMMKVMMIRKMEMREGEDDGDDDTDNNS